MYLHICTLNIESIEDLSEVNILKNTYTFEKVSLKMHYSQLVAFGKGERM